jgi:HEAT repeat protein
MTDGHIFISYARQDGRNHATRLDSDLKKAGFETWYDTRDIDPNQDFSAELEHPISESSHVVCCITPDTRRSDSFVRREIGYALAVKKPVIPLVFENTVPPIQIVNVTRINAALNAWEQTIGELSARLRHSDDRTYEQVTLPADPYRDYLTALYDQIVRYLNLTVFSLITLRGEASPDAVEKTTTNVLPMAFFDMAGIDAKTDDQTPFNNFQEAFTKYDGRVLLLGEPGAGKTTTLFAFARDAVAARLENPALPLPILAPVATWNAHDQIPLADWLAASIPALTRDDIARRIDSGHALLLLDGLDELGSQRLDRITDKPFDPRIRFMSQIAPFVGTGRALSASSLLVPHTSSLGTSLVLTCRIKDYTDIGAKLPLSGAVTLQPLNDDQMRDYLRDVPDLWAALESDNDLREVARTPLLLSLFTFAFRDLPDEAKQLRSLQRGDLRDKIFETYVHKRYEHEKRKLHADLPFSLPEITRVLGQAAMNNTRFFKADNLLDYDTFQSVLSGRTDSFLDLVCRLHLLTPAENKTFRCIHLLLHDFFAFGYASAVLTQIDEDERVRSQAAFALGRLLDVRAVDSLIVALDDPDDRVRSHAAEALGWLGEVSFDPLVAILTQVDENVFVRSHAAEGLGRLRDNRAFDPLVAVLRQVNEDTYLRSSSAEALGWLGEISFNPLMAVLIQVDEDERVRASAAAALGHSRDARAVDLLIAAMADPQGDVRYRAADALGELGDTRAVDSLIIALDDSDDGVRQRVVVNLGRLRDPRAAVPLAIATFGRDHRVRSGAYDALQRLGDGAIDPLIAALADPESRIRYFSAAVLGRLGNVRAIDPLVVTLHDPNESVRSRAAEALGRLGDTQAIDPLITALTDSDEYVRFNAAEALGRLGDTQAIDLLIAALDSPAWHIRYEATTALGELGDARAVDPLIAVLVDPDQFVRSSAADALTSIGTHEAIAAVETWRKEQAGGE